ILVVRYRPFVGWTSVGLSAVSFAASIWLCRQVLTNGLAPPAGDVWRVDALSALLTVCITLVSLLASGFGPGLGADDTGDAASTAGRLPGALHWGVLHDAAPALHPELMQLAFAFILIGYGTKAGLAPMHTWMPDAYAEAPPPIAAMMSGVLVAVSMYAIARWK